MTPETFDLLSKLTLTTFALAALYFFVSNRVVSKGAHEESLKLKDDIIDLLKQELEHRDAISKQNLRNNAEAIDLVKKVSEK